MDTSPGVKKNRIPIEKHSHTQVFGVSHFTTLLYIHMYFDGDQ